MGTISDWSRPMIDACGAGGTTDIDGAAQDVFDVCEAACAGTNAGGCFYAILSRNQTN